MTRSLLMLLAMLALGPALAGCSGFRPFWQSDPAPHRAAERSIDGPLALARLAEQRGKTLEAERLYRSLLEKSPDNAVIHHRLAIIQARKGRFEDANAYFERALRLKPDDPTLISDAAYCQYLQHQLDVAESLFRQALDIDPHHEAATNNLALVLAEKGDDRAAFALFRQTGTEARSHANMGYMYTRRGELENAKAAYSRALSLDPQMIPAAEAMVQLAHFERQARAAAVSSNRRGATRARDYTTIDFEGRPIDHEVAAAPPSEPRRPEPSSVRPEPAQASWETPQAWPEPGRAPTEDVQVRPGPAQASWETSQARPEPGRAPTEDVQVRPEPAQASWETSQAWPEPAEAPPEHSQVPSQSAYLAPEASRAGLEPLPAPSEGSRLVPEPAYVVPEPAYAVPEPAYVVPEPAYAVPGRPQVSDRSESTPSVGWAQVP